MIVKSLETMDLFSYEKLFLPLEDLGLTLVEGRNADDGGSNGAGKTSIFKSLTWVLFNDTLCAQRANDVVRQQLPQHEPIVGNTCGIVRMKVDSDDIEIHRHRKHTKHGNKLLIFVDGKEKTFSTDKHSQEWVNRRLQLDSTSFKNVCLFPQRSRGFASGTDAEQKAILERVLDLGRFAEAQKSVKSRLIELRNKLTSADTALESLKARKADTESDLSSMLRKINEWDNNDLEKGFELVRKFRAVQADQPQTDPQLPKKLADLQSQIDKRKELELLKDRLESERQGPAAKLHELKSNLAGWKKHRDGVAEKLTAQQPEKPEFSAEHYHQEVSGLNTELARFDAQIEARRADLDKATEAVQKAAQDKTCWTCGQPWPAEKLTEIRKEAEQQAKLAQESLTNHLETIKQTTAILESTRKLAEQAALWEVWENAEKAQETISLYERAVAEQEAAVAKIDDRLQEARRSLLNGLEAAEEFRALSAQKAAEDRSLGVWQANTAAARAAALIWAGESNPYTLQIGGLESRLAELEIAIRESAKKRDSLSQRIHYHELWERGFGNAGVKSLILDTVTPFLNERANEYLQVLSGGNAEVEFTTQRRIGTGELREKFDVRVSYRYGSDDYAGVSGGEGHRVDVASMFALGDLAASRARAPVRLRLLDEPFDNLDELGQERVFELLRDQISPRVGTLLVMSHDDRLTSRFEKRIMVVKEHGISRIEV